jgi:transposase-like protein
MSAETKKRARRNHTPEFKAETVRLVRSGARTVAQVSLDLGLADSLIRGWVRQADADAGQGAPGVLTTGEKEELSRLRQEVKVLRIEREILKRAATFFAKENA